MKPFRIVLLLTALAFIPLTLAELRAQPSSPSPTTTPATVTSQTSVIDGVQVGEVLIGSEVVLRFREPAGGYTAGQRADVVATRLSSAVSQGMTWDDVRVGMQNNETVLLMGDNLIATVDRNSARFNDTTPSLLAYTWAGQMQVGLQGGPVSTVAGTQETSGTSVGTTTTNSTTLAANQWPDWTNAKTKIVPIVSAGSPGVRFGAAQISGPEERVRATADTI